jgi:hypothetical protein
MHVAQPWLIRRLLPLTISPFVFSFVLSARNLPGDLANPVNFESFLVLSR